MTSCREVVVLRCLVIPRTTLTIIAAHFRPPLSSQRIRTAVSRIINLATRGAGLFEEQFCEVS
jgi:hypothetical protein